LPSRFPPIAAQNPVNPDTQAISQTSTSRIKLSYTLLILALTAAWLVPFLLIDYEEQRLVYADITMPLVNLAATVALVYAAWTTYPKSRSLGSVWLILALAQLCYTIADILWGVLEVGLHQEPFPSVADVFYLLYYPLFLVGILHLPVSPRSPKDRLKILLETAIVIISAGLYLWNFVVGPIYVQTGTEDIAILVFSLAYPLGDLLMLLAVLALIFRRHSSVPSGPLMLIVVCAIVSILTDLFFTITSLYAEFSSADLLNVGYTISYILIGMAGLRQMQLGRSGASFQDEDNHQVILFQQGKMHIYLPAATLAAAYLLLMLSFKHPLPMQNLSLAVWVGLLLVMTILLQLIVAAENNWLADRLRSVNTELEHRVEQRTLELEHTNQYLNIEIESRQAISEALQVKEALYRAVVEDIPLFICRFLPDGTLTFVNEAYCAYFNTPSEDLVGHSFFDQIPESDREYVRNSFLSLTVQSPVVKYEHRVISATGEVRWQRWIDRAVLDGERLVEYQSIGEDITEQRLASEALKESEEKFRDLFDSSTNLIQIVAPDASIIFVNQAWLDVLGYTEQDIPQLKLWDIVHPGHLERCLDAFQRTMQGESMLNCEVVFLARDGRPVYLEGNANCKFDGERPEYVRGIFHDVSQRKKAEELLVRSAFYDALTALPNRAMLITEIHNLLEKAKILPDYHYSVIFLDIDNFKLVNDSLGHTVGDALLIQVAERLKKCLRTDDLVGRLGGDEFVILLNDISGVMDAIQVAQRVLDEIRLPLDIQGNKIVCSVSIGIVLDDAAENAEGNLRDADIAMYRAKSNGKNRFELFEPAMRFQAVERLKLENDLRNALQRKEFILYYQPIVNLRDLNVCGFEALLRWDHPERGTLGPQEFISVLEETGLIVTLGEWILAEACQRAVSWNQADARGKDLIVSVNISLRQVAHPDFVHHVRTALSVSGLAPERLALEITESTIMENIDLASDVLEILSRMGVQTHIDDFGTGYSSLERLQNLPITTIKIASSFVGAITPLSDNQDLVRAITLLSQELRLNTIAEGIEDRYQLDYLLSLGCPMGQGYYFSEPVPGVVVPKVIQQFSQNRGAIKLFHSEALP
jgi:diguanylate cyclase (GGDEF)-like protein/PAS domain S-box-containing protein